MNPTPRSGLGCLLLALALQGCALPGPGEAHADQPAWIVDASGRRLAGFHEAARVPEGVEGVYARSGYLHPVLTPSGTEVTGDYCASHPHQHGVFFAWTRTRFEGREVDFWNAAERQGTVELTAFVLDDDRAGFLASLAHVDITTPGARRIALEETWRVRGRALRDATVIDLESTQSAPASPLEVLEYHYGGFAVRGPEAWEGKDGARALTSEGRGRVDGNATPARWVAMCGPAPTGGEATIAVLSGPRNSRAPEPVRIHPSNPYFCVAPCVLGAFTIDPGAPRRTRYRIVAMDGPPDAARLDELWQEFAASRVPLDPSP